MSLSHLLWYYSNADKTGGFLIALNILGGYWQLFANILCGVPKVFRKQTFQQPILPDDLGLIGKAAFLSMLDFFFSCKSILYPYPSCSLPKSLTNMDYISRHFCLLLSISNVGKKRVRTGYLLLCPPLCGTAVG